MCLVPTAMVMVRTTTRHAGIILIPVATAYMMTSVLLLNRFAAMQTMANRTAIPNSKQASFDNFLCKGVPMLTPRNRPTESVPVRVQAWTYHRFLVSPLGPRWTGRRLLSLARNARAMEPISVDMPVLATTPRARPRVTVLEL